MGTRSRLPPRVRAKDGITDVVLVSDPFHSARIAAMAKELGLRAAVSPTRTSPIRGRAELGYLVRETGAVAGGRIVGFRRLARVRHEVAVGYSEAAHLRGWCNR